MEYYVRTKKDVTPEEQTWLTLFQMPKNVRGSLRSTIPRSCENINIMPARKTLYLKNRSTVLYLSVGVWWPVVFFVNWPEMFKPGRESDDGEPIVVCRITTVRM